MLRRATEREGCGRLVRGYIRRGRRGRGETGRRGAGGGDAPKGRLGRRSRAPLCVRRNGRHERVGVAAERALRLELRVVVLTLEPLPLG